MTDSNVRFDSDGTTIAGTYCDVTGAVAAALVITGSGKLDRDSNNRMIKTDITKDVAQALAEAHVATLRYDKRGVGASGGSYLSTGMTERSADAQAALDWLAGAAPGLPLLVVGHSEGTYYAAELAAADPRVAGAVLLAAYTGSGEDVLNWQIEMMAPRLPGTAKVLMKLTRTDFVRSQRKRMARLKASSGDVIRMQGFRVNARWYREFLSNEPAAALATISVPVLAITGGHDLQVPPGDVDRIGGLVQGPFEGHVVGDLSHLFRPDPDSAGPRSYRKAVRQPVSPEPLKIITEWVTARWG
jgi:uncharacterized protein